MSVSVAVVIYPYVTTLNYWSPKVSCKQFSLRHCYL